MTGADGDEARLAQIRGRAYEIWEEEGRPQGRDDVHWKRASEEFDVAAGKPEAESALPADAGAAPAPGKRRTKKGG